ncbi:MAG: VWA-like domain-containing protein [Eubacteriales bacterium]|nr:VWA-like domain-containing protein [Eubacteriales bacterium]
MDSNELCIQILQQSIQKLCTLFPGISLAMEQMPPANMDRGYLSTDGLYLYGGPDLIPAYLESPAQVRHSILHTMMHCLFLHLLLPEAPNQRLWHLALDLWTEKQIFLMKEEELGIETTERQSILDKIDSDRTPEQILEILSHHSLNLPLPLEKLEALFARDDHSHWKDVPKDTIELLWKSAGIGHAHGTSGGRGSYSPDGEDEICLLPQENQKFRRYMEQFAFPGEAMETDHESFDYSYYTLGMQEYGNIPLIEPLEYKEVWRLGSLVIAMDTSGSCKKETLQRFLQETYALLSRKENFFEKMQVVFFQCDCWIQDTTFIETSSDWNHYIDKIKVKGRGGTDFRPVFREIERLRKEGRITKPRALLYFTDGDGVYPEQPDYETVFVLGGSKQEHLVPKWAKTLTLS